MLTVFQGHYTKIISKVRNSDENGNGQCQLVSTAGQTMTEPVKSSDLGEVYQQ